MCSASTIRALFGVCALLLSSGCGAVPSSDAGNDAEDFRPSWKVISPEPPADLALPREPELPCLRSWVCPERWVPVVHESVVDELGEPFSWCTVPPIPRLLVDGAVTPLEEDEVEGDRPICDPEVDGTFPVVGFDTCQRLGDPCPENTWPSIPEEVTGRRIYVLSGSDGGEGSESMPFGAISEAVEAAQAGDVVVVGSGVYEETVSIDKDLTIWGGCVQETVIHGPGPLVNIASQSGAVIVHGGVSATLRNLQITGEQRGLFCLGQATIDGVWIHGATEQGILCRNCQLSVTQSLIDSTVRWFESSDSGVGVLARTSHPNAETDVQLRAVTMELNQWADVTAQYDGVHLTSEDLLIRNAFPTSYSALWVLGGAQVTGQRVVTDGSRGVAVVVVDDDSSVDMEYAVVRRTRPSTLIEGTAGLLVHTGARGSMRRCVFEKNDHGGIQGLTGSLAHRATLELEDVVIVEAGRNSEDSGHWGCSVYAEHGVDAFMNRVLVDSSQDFGIMLSPFENIAESLSDRSTVVIEDVVVRETQPSIQGEWGIGLIVIDGTNLTMRRTLFDRNMGQGIYLYSSLGNQTVLTTATIEDLTVIDTQVEPASQRRGGGLSLRDLAEITVARASVRGSHEFGVELSGDGFHMQMEDVTVLDTSPIEVGDFGGGTGLLIRDGATVEVIRGLFSNNAYAGVHVRDEGSTAALTDVTIANTRHDGTGEPNGFGAFVLDGAQTTLSRVTLEANQQIGLRVSGSGTKVHADDLQITGTIPTEFVGDFRLGGVVIEDGANVEVSRAVVDDNPSYGVLVDGETSSLLLRDAALGPTSSGNLGKLGVGLRVTNGASVSVLRSLFAENYRSGIEGNNASALSLDNVLVEDTASSEYDARFGRGLHVEGGGDISIVDSQFIGNRDVSVAVFGEETSATLEHVYIGDSLERECVDLDENDPNRCIAGRGYGLGAYDGAVVTIDDVEIASSAGAGVQLADGGTVTGQNLRIHGCPVAVNLQSLPDDYDWENAVTELLLLDDEVEVDETEMSIPEMLPEG